MSKRLRRACLASATLLLAEFFGFTAAAKPPDLPVNYYDDFTPVVEGQNDSPPTVTDEELLEQQLKLLTEQVNNAQVQAEQSQETPPAPTTKRSGKIRTKREPDRFTDTTTDLRRLNEARRMFQIGERCRRDGDVNMAVNCYEETHLLSPTSRYGLLAIERLAEIDARRVSDTTGAGEEQETPETLPQPNPGEQPQRQNAAETGKVAAAREMFVIGERCRQSGDLDMARNCYNETRLLAPHSVYGRQAQIRLHQMDAARQTDQGAEEEQETPETTAPSDVSQAKREEATQKARRLIKQGYDALRRSDFLRAHRLAEQAQHLHPQLKWWEDNPGKLNADIKRAKPPRDEGLQSRVVPDLPPLEIIQEESSSRNQPGDEVSAATEPLPLFVSPPTRRIAIQSEDSETSGDNSTPSPAEFRGWLQQTGDVLRGLSGIDIDVDVSGSGSLRVRSGLQAGGLSGTITLDEAGAYFKVRTPAVDSDWEKRYGGLIVIHNR